MEYDNTNRFTLFQNDKGGIDKRPDYRGSVNIDGVEYKLSGWIKTKRDNSVKFLAGTVELAAESTPPTPEEKGNDDLPF